MSNKMFMGTLSTGVEVIAEVEDAGVPSATFPHDIKTPTEYFIAKRPLVITPVPQGNDSYGLAFLPLSPADTEGSVKIYYANVVCENVKIPEELVKAYHARFSKIQIVSSIAGIK